MSETPINIAYSPCPNDTFIFFRLAQDSDIETFLDDVETLNRLAFEGRFDVTKLSFHAWLLVQDTYQLLNTGAALGRGCGPLVISNGATVTVDPLVTADSTQGVHPAFMARTGAPAGPFSRTASR